jgi:two-component system LytT family response regulator
MPFRNGFHLLSAIPDPAFDVIFTTAYNQYAIQAIRFSALDYLLKPVLPEELKAAIDRHLQKQENAKQRERLFQNLISNIKQKDLKDFQIAVPSTDGLHFFKVTDIIRLEGQRGYTFIYLQGKKPFIASRTLLHFEEMLQQFGFIRTHKSHLVNPRQISRISNDNGFIVLADGTQVEISRRKKDEVLKLLKAV